jgi:hypothetical protein
MHFKPFAQCEARRQGSDMYCKGDTMKNPLHNSVIIIFLSGFLIFQPLIINGPNYLHGVAMAHPSNVDLVTTGATWYQNWRPCTETNCVPMTVVGTDPGLSKTYSQPILFLNEPDGGPPTSYTISVSDALQDYKKLVTEYPHAKWVVGNIVSLQSDWITQFHDSCNCSPYAWGAHAYFANPAELAQVENWLNNLHNITGGNYWITEWADTTGNIANDQAFYAWMESKSWIKRAAYFTNRVQGIESWYPDGWKVPLLDWSTGHLTDVGNWYIQIR